MNLPQFEANINVKGTFKVGPIQSPGNAIELEIRRKAAPVENGRTDLEILELVFTGALGTGADALWLNIADAKKCRLEITGKWDEDIEDIWQAEWKFTGGEPDSKTFKLTIFTDEDPYLEYLKSVSIRVSNIISKTAPGDAILTFETNYSDDGQKLLISKVADKPGIIFFESDPPQNVPNFPGDTVTLKWHTHELANRELIQVGSAYPRQCSFDGDEGEYEIAATGSDVTFRLQGDDGRRSIFRDIEIKALRPGWHDVSFTVFKGEPGFPVSDKEEGRKRLRDVQSIDLEPTVIFNADDDCLYGIFRSEFEDRENALLFKTKNPLAGWSLVQTSVPNQKGNIPEGFSSSPGVFFKGKLYLIGGSQIDKTHISSSVWYIDPNKTPNWAELKIINQESGDIPEPRMGHGVVVFRDKIWIMGGLTHAGKALNEVWSLEIEDEQGEWHRQDDAPWSPRCLISPVEYADMIWIYGGAERPFSPKLFDDLYSCDYIDEEKVAWKEQKMMGVIKGNDKKKPIASCMQVFNKKLHLFGKFRSEDDDGSRLDDPLGFCLTDRFTRTWEHFPSDGLKAWGGDRTFSYQAVNFRDKMLIAKALGNQIGEGTVLKVYVPG